jgi:hypothetical protein
VTVVWEEKWQDKAKKMILVSALLLGTIISLLTYNLDTVRNVAVSLGADISAERFPTSRLKGWRELGTEVTTLLNDVGRENTFIISYKRQYVSELAFYVKGHPTTYTLNLSGRIESQYDLWEGFEDKLGFNALYITKLGYQVPDSFAKAFDQVEEIKKVTINTGKEFVRGFSIFYCQSFRGIDRGT